MSERTIRERIGLNISRRPALETIRTIQEHEAAGVVTAWTTQGAVGIDMMTVFAAAAAQTSNILLATGIVPAFTRHPLALAGQAVALEEIAPGRLLLGVGTSHQRSVGAAYRIPMERSLARLREYMQVLVPILQTGSVSFHGEFYDAEATLPATNTPVLVSALREKAWELGGELSDGAISWNVPMPFLDTVARPAMERGAKAAGRACPPLIGHVIIGFAGAGRSHDEVRESARQTLGLYGLNPYYANMFADSGYPLEGGVGGRVTDGLVDALAFITDDDEAVAAHLRQRLADHLDDALLMVVPGPDERADESRLARIVGRM